MKKLIISALMLAVSSVTFAQFTNGGSTSAGDNSDYNKVYASFNVGSFVYSGEVTGKKLNYSGDESFGLIGFNVGYAHAFNLKKSIPLFLELGGEFNFNSGSKNEIDWDSDGIELDDDEYTVTFMNIAIPVNVLYRFAVSDNFAIAPYAGLNFKINLLGKEKDDNGNSISYFDKDKVGKDWTANRFQLGMNLGVNFIVSNKFNIGYRFQPDFIKYQSYELKEDGYTFSESTKHTNHFFTFGYIF